MHCGPYDIGPASYSYGNSQKKCLCLRRKGQYGITSHFQPWVHCILCTLSALFYVGRRGATEPGATCPHQSCPWVGLTHGLGWFGLGWVWSRFFSFRWVVSALACLHRRSKQLSFCDGVFGRACWAAAEDILNISVESLFLTDIMTFFNMYNDQWRTWISWCLNN